MGEFRNLAPGTRAPVKGTYKCEFCGSGGWADEIARSFKKTQRITLEDMEKKAKKGIEMDFDLSELLPECPTCGPQTMWALIKSAEPPE